LALRSNGTVVAWGYNSSGETTVPAGLSNVVAIAAGWQHSLAAKADGTVVAWGNTNSGRCSVPAGLSNVIDVAAGPYHSLALLKDGSVVAWGSGGYGETNIPPGLSNVVAIAAGGDPYNDCAYSLALKSDGTVVRWGAGETTLPLGGLDHVIAIAAGGDHALAVRTGPPTPVITVQPEDLCQMAGGAAWFMARGEGIGPVQYQWQFNGVSITGATGSTLTVTNVGTEEVGEYRVIVTDENGSTTSLVAVLTLLSPPLITSVTEPSLQWVGYETINVLSITVTAPGQSTFPLSYQWQCNGTNITGATSSICAFFADAAASGSYSVTVSNEAGSTSATWLVRVLLPGSICGWGANDYGQSDGPIGLTNVMSVAAGFWHTVTLSEDGTVAVSGSNLYGQTNLPGGLTNAIAIACGWYHSLALRADGTVVAWGGNDSGQSDVPVGLTNVVAIAAGGMHSLAMMETGELRAWGEDVGAIPVGVTNVTMIAAGFDFNLALKSDGTVAAWGGDYFGETNVPANLTNVVAIGAGDLHGLAVRRDGTVAAWGYNYAGQTDVPLGLSNVMAVAGGMYFSMALCNNGTVVAWGDDSLGQTNVPTALNQVKCIAAASGHAVAGVYSPLVQYPVDVSKDLLLIYNTNSVDSTFVKDYYLQYRPRVMGANILAIGCPTNEIVDTMTFSNQMLAPYLTWLTNNPTKHPQYILLFLGIPSRVQDGSTSHSGVQCQLSANTPGVAPFVTSINMNGTNDCIAYIDKLTAIGTNVHGTVFISASAAGYGNSNYELDSIRYGTGYFPNYTAYGSVVSDATNGLLASGVSLSAIHFADGLETQTSIVVYSNGIPVQTNIVAYDLPHITIHSVINKCAC
jgi:alpha-tubulin suppressor-like RCC1 family protein